MKFFKPKFLCAAIALAGMMLMATSCDSDNDDIKNISSEYSSALSNMFPGVKNASWEQKGAYKVADFTYDGYEKEAWFDAKAQWTMTQTEYNKNLSALPEAVQTSFAKSQYASSKIDDVDGYERTDATFYVIEVEQTNSADQDIYFNADGTITKVVPADGNEVTPTSPIQ